MDYIISLQSTQSKHHNNDHVFSFTYLKYTKNICLDIRLSKHIAQKTKKNKTKTNDLFCQFEKFRNTQVIFIASREHYKHDWEVF